MTRILLLCLIAVAYISPLSATAVARPVNTTYAFTQIDQNDLAQTLGRALTAKEVRTVKAFNRKNLRNLRRVNRQELKLQSAGNEQSSTDSNGLAIAGFVCGVVGLLVGGLILGPLGIIFGAIGYRRAKEEGRKYKGLALAGLICGIVATAGALIIVLAA